MIKSGRKNETPLGHVTKDSLSQSLPFSLALSAPPPSQTFASLPPSRFFTSSFPFLCSLLLSSPLPSLCGPSGHRSVHSASRGVDGGWVRVGGWEMEARLPPVKMAEGTAGMG